MKASQQQEIKNQAEKSTENLLRFGKTRVVTAVAKYIILNAPYFWNGTLMDVRAKSLGAGVYELRTRQNSKE